MEQTITAHVILLGNFIEISHLKDLKKLIFEIGIMEIDELKWAGLGLCQVVARPA